MCPHEENSRNMAEKKAAESYMKHENIKINFKSIKL